MFYNGKVFFMVWALATKLEAITTKSTNTKSTTDNIQPRITAIQCCARSFKKLQKMTETTIDKKNKKILIETKFDFQGLLLKNSVDIFK